MVGSKEWSGELITREEGVITDLDNWTIHCEDIFLADIGSGAYTSYEVDKGGFKAVDIVEMYDSFPKLFEGEKKVQHIHTHHNMSTFFSGTDWENLEDRGVLSNYFMMLIVNFKGEYCAKVAYKAKLKSAGKEKIEFFNNQDGFRELELTGGEMEKEVLVVMDCEIIMPEEDEKCTDYRKMMAYNKVASILKEAGEDEQAGEFLMKAMELSAVPQSFVDRYEHVKKAVEEEAAKKPWKSTGSIVVKDADKTPSTFTQSKIPFNEHSAKNRDYTNWNDDGWEDGWGDYSNAGWPDTSVKKNKSIMEMTDAEYREYMEGESSPTKMNDTDACMLINAALKNKPYPIDVSNPMSKIVEMDEKVKNRVKFAEEFVLTMRDHFDILYPYSGDEVYLELLGVIVNKMNKYKNCKLVAKIMDVITEEQLETEQLIKD